LRFAPAAFLKEDFSQAELSLIGLQIHPENPVFAKFLLFLTPVSDTGGVPGVSQEGPLSIVSDTGGLASGESMKMAKSITDATKEEAHGSELIVKSIEAVSNATNRNMEVFAGIGEMVALLTEHRQLLQDEMSRFRVKRKGN
jgi:hypothetical protein